MDNVKFFVTLRRNSAGTSVMTSRDNALRPYLMDLTNAVGCFTEGIALAIKHRILSPPAQIS